MAAYNEGEEWLDQLLTYLEGNVKYVRDYCDKNIPEIKSQYSGMYLSYVAGLPRPW